MGWVVGVRWRQIYTMSFVFCRFGWVVRGSRVLLSGSYRMGVVEVVGTCSVPGVGLFECRHRRVRDLCLCSMMCMCGQWTRERWMLYFPL